MLKRVMMMLLVVIICTTTIAREIDLSEATIVVLEPEKKIMSNAADMLQKEILKRTRIKLAISNEMPRDRHRHKKEYAIVIGNSEVLAAQRKSFKPASGHEVPANADAYSVWTDRSRRKVPTVCVAGYDDRGTFFAVGRLLRILEMSRDRLELDPDIKISTAPKYSLRGHQYGYRPKTNSYDAWTVEMWEQQFREMMIFGMNAIELIPPRTDDADDSPHLPMPMLDMMVEMSQLAQDYQLELWIWFPAIDEDYTDKATLDAAMEEWSEVYRLLPKIDVIFVPGGDPGDTHPKILFDFMEKQKESLTHFHPDAELWMSPQGFDWKRHRAGWMDAFVDIMQNDQPEWLDGIVFGPQIKMTLPELRTKVPVKYEIRRYPDITHTRSSQYADPNWDRAWQKTLDREPINPRPVAYTKVFRDLQDYSFGFITYSEGCNDDFNKVLWSCLGWDSDMDPMDIAKEYSRFFISPKYEDRYAEGLFALEQNWIGPLKDTDQPYKTLELFQVMEKKATPQMKLSWRFQQGLYRAYYDAYVKAKYDYEMLLEDQAIAVLSNAAQMGSIESMDQAEAILDKAVTNRVNPEWRARTITLAEALYQSIRMQLSVDLYQGQRVLRGANLDNIDNSLNNSEDIKEAFAEIRKMDSEQQRLAKIAEISRE
jgi:hypothetical protein